MAVLTKPSEIRSYMERTNQVGGPSSSSSGGGRVYAKPSQSKEVDELRAKLDRENLERALKAREKIAEGRGNVVEAKRFAYARESLGGRQQLVDEKTGRVVWDVPASAKISRGFGSEAKTYDTRTASQILLSARNIYGSNAPIEALGSEAGRGLSLSERRSEAQIGREERASVVRASVLRSRASFVNDFRAKDEVFGGVSVGVEPVKSYSLKDKMWPSDVSPSVPLGVGIDYTPYYEIKGKMPSSYEVGIGGPVPSGVVSSGFRGRDLVMGYSSGGGFSNKRSRAGVPNVDALIARVPNRNAQTFITAASVPFVQPVQFVKSTAGFYLGVASDPLGTVRGVATSFTTEPVKFLGGLAGQGLFFGGVKGGAKLVERTGKVKVLSVGKPEIVRTTRVSEGVIKEEIGLEVKTQRVWEFGPVKFRQKPVVSTVFSKRLIDVDKQTYKGFTTNIVYNKREIVPFQTGLRGRIDYDTLVEAEVGGSVLGKEYVRSRQGTYVIGVQEVSFTERLGEFRNLKDVSKGVLEFYGGQRSRGVLSEKVYPEYSLSYKYKPSGFLRDDQYVFQGDGNKFSSYDLGFVEKGYSGGSVLSMRGYSEFVSEQVRGSKGASRSYIRYDIVGNSKGRVESGSGVVSSEVYNNVVAKQKGVIWSDLEGVGFGGVKGFNNLPERSKVVVFGERVAEGNRLMLLDRKARVGLVLKQVKASEGVRVGFDVELARMSAGTVSSVRGVKAFSSGSVKTVSGSQYRGMSTIAIKGMQEYEIRSGVALKQNNSLRNDFGVSSKLFLREDSVLKNSLKIDSGVKVSQGLGLKQSQDVGLKTSLKQGLVGKSFVGGFGNLITLSSPPNVPPDVYGLPDVEQYSKPRKRKVYKGKKAKYSYGYNPSLEAELFDISGPIPSRVSVGSGLMLRPKLRSVRMRI